MTSETNFKWLLDYCPPKTVEENVGSLKLVPSIHPLENVSRDICEAHEIDSIDRIFETDIAEMGEDLPMLMASGQMRLGYSTPAKVGVARGDISAASTAGVTSFRHIDAPFTNDVYSGITNVRNHQWSSKKTNRWEEISWVSRKNSNRLLLEGKIAPKMFI